MNHGFFGKCITHCRNVSKGSATHRTGLNQAQFNQKLDLIQHTKLYGVDHLHVTESKLDTFFSKTAKRILRDSTAEQQQHWTKWAKRYYFRDFATVDKKLTMAMVKQHLEWIQNQEEVLNLKIEENFLLLLTELRFNKLGPGGEESKFTSFRALCEYIGYPSQMTKIDVFRKKYPDKHRTLVGESRLPESTLYAILYENPIDAILFSNHFVRRLVRVRHWTTPMVTELYERLLVYVRSPVRSCLEIATLFKDLSTHLIYRDFADHATQFSSAAVKLFRSVAKFDGQLAAWILESPGCFPSSPFEYAMRENHELMACDEVTKIVDNWFHGRNNHEDLRLAKDDDDTDAKRKKDLSCFKASKNAILTGVEDAISYLINVKSPLDMVRTPFYRFLYELLTFVFMLMVYSSIRVDVTDPLLNEEYAMSILAVGFVVDIMWQLVWGQTVNWKVPWEDEARISYSRHSFWTVTDLVICAGLGTALICRWENDSSLTTVYLYSSSFALLAMWVRVLKYFELIPFDSIQALIISLKAFLVHTYTYTYIEDVLSLSRSSSASLFLLLPSYG
jgi:hypothetical protein